MAQRVGLKSPALTSTNTRSITGLSFSLTHLAGNTRRATLCSLREAQLEHVFGNYAQIRRKL